MLVLPPVVARGDFALGFLGEVSMPIDDHRVALGQLRAYLDGQPVDRHGFSASISWPAPLGLTSLPLNVHATGPTVIGLDAVVADRPTFAVGAQPAGVRWRSRRRRGGRTAAGLDPDGLRVGALLKSSVASDPNEAARLVRGNVSTFAHIAETATPDVEPLPGGGRRRE